MGGLAVDGTARVLTAAGDPIAGLYAVGETCGGLHGGPRAGYVVGLIAAIVLGLAAAADLTASHEGTTRRK